MWQGSLELFTDLRFHIQQSLMYATIMQSRGYIFTLIFIIIIFICCQLFFVWCNNSESDIDQFCSSSYLVAPPVDYPLGEKTTLLELEFLHLMRSSGFPSYYLNVTNNSTNINNFFTFHSIVQINAQTCDFHFTRMFFNYIITQKLMQLWCIPYVTGSRKIDHVGTRIGILLVD